MPENYSFLTADEILTPARDEAVTSANPQITALQDEQVIEFIHWLNGEFIIAAHDRHHAGGWSWMEKPGGFIIYPNTALSANVAAGAATFGLSSASNWDNTGRTCLETTRGGLDFPDHSNKASNTLTVDVSGQQIAIRHVSGNRAHKLYPVATDFGRVKKLWVNQVPFIAEKFEMRFPQYQRYTLHGQFFFFPRGMSESDCTYLYEKTPADITELDSVTNIPRRFKRWAVEMTLFHLFRIRRKRSDLQTTLELAEAALQTALNYDSVQSTSININLAP